MFAVALLCASAVTLSSCYSYTTIVGKGAQDQSETTKWNHYVVDGLAPLEVSDAKEMANGAQDYTVYTRQTFVNGLLAALTFGIYTPTTTTVTK